MAADTPIIPVDVVLIPLGAAEVPAAGAGTAGAAGVGAGSVFVDSRPPGAAVRIDDEPAGVTPVLVSGVARPAGARCGWSWPATGRG